MAENIGTAIGLFIVYVITVVAFAYAGALAGLIVGLATSNTLFGGLSLTTIFAWIGVGLAHILFVYSVKVMHEEYRQEKIIEAFAIHMKEDD